MNKQDTIILQRTLRFLGENPGPIDGIWGNKTQKAVDRADESQLTQRLADYLETADLSSLSREAAKDLQAALTFAGHDPKGIDGKLGQNSMAAIEAFRAAHCIENTPFIGPAQGKTTAHIIANTETPEATVTIDASSLISEMVMQQTSLLEALANTHSSLEANVIINQLQQPESSIYRAYAQACSILHTSYDDMENNIAADITYLQAAEKRYTLNDGYQYMSPPVAVVVGHPYYPDNGTKVGLSIPPTMENASFEGINPTASTSEKYTEQCSYFDKQTQQIAATRAEYRASIKTFPVKGSIPNHIVRATLYKKAEKESDHHPAASNRFGYVGIGQFSVGALYDAGYVSKEGYHAYKKQTSSATNYKLLDNINGWSGFNNIESLADFITLPEAQTDAASTYAKKNYSIAKHNGAANKGYSYTVAGCHLLGPQGYINATNGTGKVTDGNNTDMFVYASDVARYVYSNKNTFKDPGPIEHISASIADTLSTDISCDESCRSIEDITPSPLAMADIQGRGDIPFLQ